MPRPHPTDVHAHPRDLVAEAVHDYGEHAVIDMCLALLEGHTDYHLLPVPLSYFGGAHAVSQLDRGHNLVLRRQEHWPRVWAARALRYVWQPYAEPGVVAALSDPAWRVRETAAKLVGQRELGSGAEELVPLVADEMPRVRVAAIRALGVVGEYEHAVLLADLDDHETLVRIAIEGARRRLRVRLDRAV